MKNNKLIDQLQIGGIEFEAYIIIDDNDLEAFAVYFQKSKEPLILFKQVSKDFKVEIEINQQQVDFLQQFKSKDLEQRKEQFKLFQEFVLNTEQKAKEIAFQDNKLTYYTDIQLIKSIEEAYLID